MEQGVQGKRADLDIRLEDLERMAKEAAAVLREAVPGATGPSARLDTGIAGLDGVVAALHRAMAATPGGAVQDADPQARSRAALLRTRVRSTAAEWPQIRALLAAQVAPVRRPLWAPMPDPHAAAWRRAGAVDDLLHVLHGLLGRVAQDDGADRAGAFADIPLPHCLFLDDLLAARRVLLARQGERADAFLDVGCGLGVKVLAAAPFFSRAVGLEYDPGYAAAARALLDRSGVPNVTVVQGDGRSFAGYGDFDVVYFFRPMKDAAGLVALERAIADSVRPFTILIAPYRQFAARADALGCRHVGGHVWLAGVTRDDVADLARRALWIGHAAKRAVPRVAGPWEPVLRTLADRGYAPPEDRSHRA